MHGGLPLTWVAVTAVLAACGVSGDAQKPPLRATPSHYLLTIDQLATPDFTVVEPLHSLDVATLSAGDTIREREMQAEGFTAAARVGFFRQADLATSNGPLEIIATAEAFNDSGGAHRAFGLDVQRRDASPGESPVSTGPLGDEAHADGDVTTAPGGIPVVQITLEWRVANVVNTVVVRGRYGGARLDDALLLAHRMTGNEGGAS
jgi:hypothetical protein